MQNQIFASILRNHLFWHTENIETINNIGNNVTMIFHTHRCNSQLQRNIIKTSIRCLIVLHSNRPASNCFLIVFRCRYLSCKQAMQHPANFRLDIHRVVFLSRIHHLKVSKEYVLNEVVKYLYLFRDSKTIYSDIFVEIPVFVSRQ